MAYRMWDNSKENIQPLNGERKMAADPSHDVHTEMEKELSMADLEKNITTYAGDDPIAPYVQYINFLQHHHQEAYQSKLKDVLLTCMKRFMRDPRYTNDTRYVGLYLKSINGVATIRQINLIRTALSRGVGTSVAKMYTTIAELYERDSKYSLALDIIRDGLKWNAQPRNVLEEYAHNLEVRITAENATSMNQGLQGRGDARLFASTVPPRPRNEDACIRIELPPVEENGKPPSSFNPARQTRQLEEGSENTTNPTKLNPAGARMSEPTNIPPFEKVQIYVSDEEDSVVFPEPCKVMSMPKGVLAERKVEEATDFVEGKPVVAPEVAHQGPTSRVPSNIPEGLTFIIRNHSAPRAMMEDTNESPEPEIPKSDNAWENSKENIQPLSGGRKITSLNHSLKWNDSATDLDVETQLSIEKMETSITTYSGDDPIAPWIQYISFLQQHCLNEHGKYNSKYKDVLETCLKKFTSDPRYKNDKRYLEIYLKSIHGVPTVGQIAIIQTVLSRGVGSTVAKMYTTLAELYERNNQNSLALEIIRKGLKLNAEPRDVLEEYEHNLEFRIAMELAKSMTQCQEEGSEVRNFGNSVPLDYNMEAASVRIELPPAHSSKAAPVSQKLHKVSVFVDDENGKPRPSSLQLTSFDPVREMQQLGEESENIINPTKWNSAGVKMPEPTIVPRFEKVQIYVSDEEDSLVFPAPSKAMPLPKGVLAERKLEEVVDCVEAKLGVAPDDAQGIKKSASSGLFTSAPDQECQTNYAQLGEVQNPPKPVQVVLQQDTKKYQFQKPAVPVQVVVPKDGAGAERPMFRKAQLERGGKEISFEELRSELFFKRLAAIIPKVSAEAVIPTGKDQSFSSDANAEIRELRAEFQTYRAETKKTIDDLETYKVESKKVIDVLHNKTKQLHETLEAACSAWATVMAKSKVLEEEILGLKMKRPEPPTQSTKPANFGLIPEIPKLPNRQTFNYPGDENVKMDIENRHVDVERKPQVVNSGGSILRRTPYEQFTTIETYQEPHGGNFGTSFIDVVPDSDFTEAIFNKEDNFNISNLTHALNFGPKPIHSSSPGKKGNDAGYDEDDGDFGPRPVPFQTPYTKRNTFNQTVQEVAQNLSTIQETSKERSSSTTGGSSSSNLTGYTSARNSTIFMRSASKSGNPPRYYQSQSEY